MKRRILIADSEQWAVQALGDLARRLGHDVFAAANGIEALERFKSVAPHVLVVDNLLPKMDGLRVTAKIRATDAGRVIPIVLATAVYRRDDDLRDLQQRYGFSDLLEKPFTQAQAEAILGTYLAEETDERSTEDDQLAAVDMGVAGVPVPEEKLGGRTVADTFLELFRRRATGILTVRRDDVTKVIFFDRGAVTHARSNSKLDRLGRILTRNRRITPEDYERARRLQNQSGGSLKIGQALVGIGLLSEDEVRNAVLAQVTNIVLGLFSWNDGSLSFHDTTRLPPDYVRFNLNTPDLVFWGLRRLEGEQDFRSRLPNSRYVLERPSGSERVREQVSLTSFEEQVLAMADGKRRLGEILSIGQLGQVDVARVLYSFLALGILSARPEGQDEQRPESSSALLFEKKGYLDKMPAANVIARLWLAGASGRLHLLKPDAWRELHFDRGNIVWARSSLTDQRLGEVLLRAGKVAPEDHKRALEIQARSPGRRLGSVFLELRSLTLEELDWALRFQVQRVFLESLSWSEGAYAFEERQLPVEDMITLTASTPDLILEGARRYPAPESVKALVASSGTLFLKTWDQVRVARHLKLGRNEMRLLDVLETGRTGPEVLSLGIAEEEELTRMLHGLLALEVVKAAQGVAAEPSISEGAFEPAEMVKELAGEDGVMAAPSDDEDSGVIHLGQPRISPEEMTRLTLQCQALKAENSRLKARVASLESRLRKATRSGDGGSGPVGNLDETARLAPGAFAS